VACQWRIRHKLMLGLGLVVAILAILLVGTLKGLASYRATMRTMDSKLVELNDANSFREAVSRLKSIDETPAYSSSEELKQDALFEGQIAVAENALVDYEQKLNTTVALERDPDHGDNEKGFVEALKADFGNLKSAWEKTANLAVSDNLTGSGSLRLSNKGVQKAIQDLVRDAKDLIDTINENLYKRIDQAKEDYKISLAIVLSTAAVGILLTASLLRFFYGWIFYPIRRLEQGAGRVAQGDFEHRIEVHSGDEMEDLAAAFNDMTGQLREMYRDLARQVNERSRQLVRSERLAGVGFLAAGVAHEINNPLASIAFCSEALEGRLADVLASKAPAKALADDDRETVTKYLKMIQQEAFRCKEITQRLLEFSRGGERRREQTDLAELTQGVLDVAQHLQNCKGKKLNFRPSGHIKAWVNAQEIKSVVLNLVVNALDSMDDGGKLEITLSERDRMAELVFADTGCGMTPEILENIFEPFFTRSRTGKGTGLGLSISHRIINQHGGEIEAVSPGLNQGSTFTVRLPLQPAEPALPAGPEGGATILSLKAAGAPKEETLGHAAA
jgi:signal transduction histidine kinase